MTDKERKKLEAERQMTEEEQHERIVRQLKSYAMWGSIFRKGGEATNATIKSKGDYLQ